MVHMYCKSYLQSQANLSFKSACQICAFRGRPYESANRKRKNAFAHTLYYSICSISSNISCSYRSNYNTRSLSAVNLSPLLQTKKMMAMTMYDHIAKIDT